MNPQETLLAVAAGVAAVMVIVVFAHKSYIIIKRIDDALGLDQDGKTINERLERIEHQLYPNNGSSLIDKMNRVEFEQRSMQSKVDTIETVLDLILRRMDKV